VPDYETLRWAPPWTSQVSTPLPDVLREINKTSNNVAAPHAAAVARRRRAAAARRSVQRGAAARLDLAALARGWPTTTSASTRARASRAWSAASRARWCSCCVRHGAASGSRSFVESLPIAGVDGTLAHRLRNGSATGHAFLKTGTLRDTRALAGYVRARSGTVYAVAAVVNHAEAGRGHAGARRLHRVGGAARLNEGGLPEIRACGRDLPPARGVSSSDTGLRGAQKASRRFPAQGQKKPRWAGPALGGERGSCFGVRASSARYFWAPF
jgi:hypothetical protein